MKPSPPASGSVRPVGDGVSQVVPEKVVPRIFDSLTEFLPSVPLHAPHAVDSLFENISGADLNWPSSIYDHCEIAKCGGVRRFYLPQNGVSSLSLVASISFHHGTYICVNCGEGRKVFGLRCVRIERQSLKGTCTKIFQEPTFGEPIPQRLFKVIGEENREHFLNARRAIARSLGIGAYAYYRRIVENNKFNLVASILQVAEATNASADQVGKLKEALKETQFSKAIAIIGDAAAIPAVMLIDGHNPLLILHDVLSEGIHEMSDFECLERARHAEVILSEIANRLQIALTERKVLKDALSSVTSRKKVPPTST